MRYRRNGPLLWVGLGAAAVAAGVAYYAYRRTKSGVASLVQQFGPMPMPNKEGDFTPTVADWSGACTGATRGITMEAALTTLKLTAAAASKAVGYPVGSPMYCVLVKQAALTVKVKRVTTAAAITQAKQDLAYMTKAYDAAMKAPAPQLTGLGTEASMFGADRGGAMMRPQRVAHPSTAQVVQSVVAAPSPVDASRSRPIAPAPDPSARPRPIGCRTQREAAGISIFGGRVYEQDAVAAQSIMPQEIPGHTTEMLAPVGPPPRVQGMMPAPMATGPAAPSAPAYHEHAWRSIFGNRIDSQHLPPPEAVLPPAAAAAVHQKLATVHPAQRAAAWRSIFGNMQRGMSGWHGHYKGFGGLIGFGGG